MGKPTISDLAKAAGVSVTTVSHAFSGRRHVDPETRKRIQTLADQIGYHPSSMARALRSGRTGTIALASSMPFAVAAGPSRLGFLMEIAASAAMSALTRDLALCLIPPHPSAQSYGSAGFDGVILVEPMRDDPLVAHFEQRKTPIVSIGTVPGRPDIPAVDIRSRETAQLLLTHLAEQGCRQIAALIGASSRTSQIESEAAYDEFVASRQWLSPMLRMNEDEGEEIAYRETLRLLHANPAIDGIFAAIDAFASGAVRAARELGRTMPGQLRIVTRYDGLRAKLSQPPLTAVDLYLPTIAEEAVHLLLDRIDGTSRMVTAELPKLIVRQSSEASG
ncbi:substrate-binding domain-containing protein [Paracoccus onubensis]|uniref:LacI family DNA-binding transcriptional regulator n=1 Tax=Paracoccus onubensis TaxID=1675788 RepID=A0A418SME7_9RHOB|nr:substrate-binding domain-containing protein [Paracoccus onubensis]RJE82099.1 LacI family DNA-binding transcriptional regulator [Paracoccus onubensis]